MEKNIPTTFGCPVELALTVLGGKWKTVILAHLKQGPLRYGELRARIPALSDKVLTQRVRDLETLGLVARDKEGAYVLTQRGVSLGPVLQSLYDWGDAAAPELGARFRAAG